MRKKISTEVNSMTEQERSLMVETLGEMRELKGEMREFKQHVIERVSKLEKKDNERSKERISVLSLIVASIAVLISVIVNFLKYGGR